MTATVGHDRRFYIPEGAGRVKGADVVTVASQDPSGAIATPPTWALWPSDGVRVPSEVSRWAGLWLCKG